MRMMVAGLVAVSLSVSAAAADEPDGRWVDFGPWNGVVDCESSPTPGYPHLTARHHPTKRAAEVRADQVSWTSDRGVFQFQQRSWDWVAPQALVGVDPRRQTLKRQLRQAQRLRDIDGGGISHWVCGYRYGDGTGPRFVTGELVSPANPARCAERLARHTKRRIADSVCGVSDE